PLYFIQKKQKSKTSFTGAFDFLVQKGLMGQPPQNYQRLSSARYKDSSLTFYATTPHTPHALSGQKRCRTPLVSPWRKPIFLKQSPG
ncbi:hypothetical protein CVM48_05410, partial [Staphylococcus pseudintermedius]